jgi:hypothetical protein
LYDGSPLSSALWSVDEPDDIDNNENHAEQLVFFNIGSTERHLRDIAGNGARGILCECDGKTWSATARAYYDADPNNPN